MKKIFFLLFITVIAFACGNQEGSKENTSDTSSGSTTETVTEPVVQDVTANPDYLKGLELIAGSDCLTCHAVDEKDRTQLPRCCQQISQ